MTDGDITFASAFDTHQPGLDCDRFEPHTHNADGSIMLPAGMPPWVIGRKRSAEVSSIDQPPPIPNDSVPIWDLVIADMHERDQVGRERYGTPLQTGNGRDMLADAYAEGLDLVVYLRGEMAKRRLTADDIERVWRAWNHDSRNRGNAAFTAGAEDFRNALRRALE